MVNFTFELCRPIMNITCFRNFWAIKFVSLSAGTLDSYVRMALERCRTDFDIVGLQIIGSLFWSFLPTRESDALRVYVAAFAGALRANCGRILGMLWGCCGRVWGKSLHA